MILNKEEERIPPTSSDDLLNEAKIHSIDLPAHYRRLRNEAMVIRINFYLISSHLLVACHGKITVLGLYNIFEWSKVHVKSLQQKEFSFQLQQQKQIN